MRISDWSSDVCSSDLVGQAGGGSAVEDALALDLDLHGFGTAMRKALAHLIGVAALGQAQLAPVAEAQRRLAVLVLGIAIGPIVQRVRPCPLRPRHPPPRPFSRH